MIFHIGLSGQPVWESKKTIENYILFGDLHNPYIKYYAPGQLKLKRKENGEPDFILTQLRYTGVSLSGNQGEKRFTNIIQMTIEMEQMDIENMRKLFRLAPGVKLVSLPIHNLESSLIYSTATLGSSDEPSIKKLNGFFQGNENATGIFWTERNFTLALDNTDAQIIEDQLKNNRLAFSFSYAFYADVVVSTYKDLVLKGNTEFKKDILSGVSDVMQPDTATTLMVVRSNSFSVAIDLEQFPNCIKKVDINQNQTPPAYAYVEVRCNDFNNKIRNDLFFKTFELEAQGVNGTPVTGELKFSASKPDEHTMTVKFPYAVKMNIPPRYRVTETNQAGERIPLPWIYLKAWKPMIDITTDLEQLDIEEKSVDIELDTAWVSRYKPDRVEIWARYYFIHKPQVQVVTFNTSEMKNLKNMTLRYDRHGLIQYRKEIIAPSSPPKDTWHDLTDDYLFIK